MIKSLRHILAVMILSLFCLAPTIQAAVFLTPSNPPPVVSLAWDLAPSMTYNVYYGVGSRQYTNVVPVGSTNFCTITLVRGATYYFAATAIDSSGLESIFGSEVSYTPKVGPAPPANMRQPLVLTVQMAPTPDGPYVEAGMNWSFLPDSTNQFFKVLITQADPVPE